MSTVTVTPQQVAAARLRVALDADDGRESDAWVVMLANAHAAVESTAAAEGMTDATAREAADALVRDALTQRDALINDAAAATAQMVKEAADHKAAILEELNTERARVARDIEQLRAFEGDYRDKLRGYIEDHIRQLDGKSTANPDSIAPVIDLVSKMKRDLDVMETEEHRYKM